MLAIRVGTLIDGRGGRPISGAVVEVDGERAFTYFVQPDALRQRLRG